MNEMYEITFLGYPRKWRVSLKHLTRMIYGKNVFGFVPGLIPSTEGMYERVDAGEFEPLYGVIGFDPVDEKPVLCSTPSAFVRLVKK